MKLDLMSEIQVGSPVAGGNKPVERPASSATGAARPAAKSSSSGSGVTVTLSSQSQALGVDAQGTEVVDSSKVEAMRSAIANGSFQVNAEAIADKLLSNASEMLSSAKR